MMATNTIDARVKSIHGHQYCQVFGNKDFFVESYPIEKRLDCHKALDRFVKDYGASDVMQYDSAPEQVGPHTKFQANMRKCGIKGHTAETKRSNQNPAEGVTRELRKKWYREMFCTYIPRGLWCYGYPYVANTMQLKSSTAGKVQGRTPLELITGETPDISEYLDFGWYEGFCYKEDAGLGENKLGQLLGTSQTFGLLMSYWVFPKSDIQISRTKVQRVTHLETKTDAKRKRFEHYDTAITERLHEVYTQAYLSAPSSDNPTMETWKELADGDKDFQNELAIVFDNTDVKEDDDKFTPDSYDNYINMDLALDRGGDQTEYARFKK